MVALVEKHMAKKKSGNTGRKIPLSPDELRELAERLESEAARISKLAGYLDQSGNESVMVDGPGHWDRGIDGISDFVRNIHIALVSEGVQTIDLD